jgi:CHAT domain-containing protein
MAPDAEDGFLNAEEVSLMNLEGTELVFLSACETVLGEARIGEGLLGLAQAFCQAGARTCIVNLWKVSDEETTVSLVTEFYARLKAGASRSAALRSAKQFARQQGAEPRDWGGFVCLGAHDVVIGLAKPDLHHLEA